MRMSLLSRVCTYAVGEVEVDLFCGLLGIKLAELKLNSLQVKN